MILKLNGVDPEGLSRLKKLTQDDRNFVDAINSIPHPRDARVRIPQPVRMPLVEILSVKNNEHSRSTDIRLKVEILVREEVPYFEFTDEDVDVGASLPQKRFVNHSYPVPRELVTVVLNCLGLFPSGLFANKDRFYLEGPWFENLPKSIVDQYNSLVREFTDYVVYVSEA
jgi:hypothetical protein